MRWFVVVLVGCAGGEGGKDKGGDTNGPAAAGDDDDAAVQPGLVWVDAEGVEVPGVVYLGDRLSYVDSDGYFWPLDPWATGTEAFVPSNDGTLQALWDGLGMSIVFANADCTEPWAAYLPRPPGVVAIVHPYVSSLAPESFERRTFVAASNASRIRLYPAYALNGTDCEDGAEGEISLSDMIEVEPPSTTWTAPLHPEYH